ncbi:receptor-like protein 7 [Rhododendron vialii]|uniref:receptor-like protein 7 n=1 Tax=Rhododendron vialii TaxID=182163 RepID=UPI00265FE7F4|nr:receptor-like protein 7 [Rhododendron vialii]XP_058214630.1 receptor-like protein 7 [Rhododendron vialii]
MRTKFITWFFSIATITIFFSITIPVHSQCLEDQKSLLLQLKSSLEFDPDSSVKLANWAGTNDCCQWNGVTCDRFGRVIGLDLNTESISRGLNDSSSLFQLKFLEKLDLANNNFNIAEIPSNFGGLTNLRYLNLSNTQFFGQIPMEFSRLTRLVKIDLSKDIYYDGIPRFQIENPNLVTLFRNLSGLTELYLDGVNISANGHEWGQAISSSMPNLRVLSLSGCLISGPIDSSLQKLQYLSEINLAQNNISSPIPDFLANFPNLTVLILSNSELHGTFPDNIFQRVQTLETLDLSGNALLNGSLPDFPEKGSLRNLYLSLTNFSGNLPESIGNLTELRRIEINGCYFSGPIPSSLANLSQLVHLDFSTNNFSGSMPLFQGSKNLTSIDLSNNALTGPVPSIVFEGLSNLVHISLMNNSFNGSIPSSLFSLPSMQQIWLTRNQFSEVSEFLPNKSMSTLDTLELSHNKLQGPIPSYFFDFQSLRVLSLSFNNFSGTVQLESIHRFQNLTDLELSHNSLSVNASINDSILSSFPQLQWLGLASCKLQKFPPLMNLPLYYLDLSDNQISGVIPNWIWNIGNGSLSNFNLSFNLLVGLQPEYVIPRLQILILHSNQLCGEIPIPPDSTRHVDYSRNNFSSSIPAEIGNGIANARFFSLSHNKLSGPIPPSICNGSNLDVLNLSNNRFSGTIPQCLITTGAATIRVLNLQNNNLTGNITGTFPKHCALRTLDLSENLLEGHVPKSLANCANAEVLNLGINNIYGTFPCFLANLSNLRVLVLRSNKFQGNISCQGIHNYIWPELQIIDLALNNFSGTLPPSFFSQRKAMMDGGNARRNFNHLRFEVALQNIYYEDSVTVTNKGSEMELVKILTIFIAIDFSNNNFKGEIPYIIGDLKSLYVLNLSHNSLVGSIPSSVGNLAQLGSLDLSWNKLGGNIPVTLARLTFLAFLNLSYNQLIGMIPTGPQLQLFPNTSFEGNKGLWGPPLTATEAEPAPPTQSYAKEDEINWVYVIATLGYAAGFGVVVGPLLYSKRWRQCYYKPLDRVIVRILYLREQRARHQRRRDNINQLRRRQHH